MNMRNTAMTWKSAQAGAGILLVAWAVAPACGGAQAPQAQSPPPPGNAAAAPAERPAGRLGDPGNRFAGYKLSYIQGDRAAALLKVLGYSVIEFQTAGPPQVVYDKVFDTLPSKGELRLPVVIRLIDPEKTSLLEPAQSAAPGGMGGPPPGYGGGAAAAGLSLGGTFLDRVTDGAPQQRLLIVYDANDTEPMQRLVNLLHDQIDVPAQQILIEALVVELNQDRVRDLGIDFNAKNDGSTFSFSSTDVKNVAPFTYVFDHPSKLPAPLTLQVTISALVKRGDAQVLSRPSVLVLDGRQARIQVGEKIPISSFASNNNTTFTATEYVNTGIVLNLRPRLSEDRSEITMQVETLISSADTTSSLFKSGSAPPILSREVQTLVRVADDTPFVIGGLIGTDQSLATQGLPGLSRIPFLGALFRRESKSRTRREVIVVITPHAVPLGERAFTYVVPKSSEIFESFDNELFRNAYYLRQSDIFDTSFVHQSQVLQSLLERLRSRAEAEPGLRHEPPFKSLFAGRVPGEGVLVRRMLWELVRSKGFQRYVDPEKIIFFEDTGDEQGMHVTPLASLFKARSAARGNALVLTFKGMRATTEEHPFDPPRGVLSYEQIPAASYLERLRQGNRKREDGGWEVNTLPLTADPGDTTPPLERLQGVLVLKRLLELNPELPLTLKDFHVGREIIFPSVADLRGRLHLVDREAVQLFYEVADYYRAFEQDFTRETRRIQSRLEGHASR